MGAVRIYKDTTRVGRWANYVWQVRSDGCEKTNPQTCHYGKSHRGFCSAATTFYGMLSELNDPTSSLGAYLKK